MLLLLRSAYEAVAVKHGPPVHIVVHIVMAYIVMAVKHGPPVQFAAW